MSQPTVARLIPELPFPPYTYVPGRAPHPTRDPAGHSFGKPPPIWETIDPDQWSHSRLYLYGIDLFNYGYYWEAHEAWEMLWHASGRSGETADFLKALIALAAAGVKFREGRDRGVRHHAARARMLFDQVAQQLGPEQKYYLGLDPRALSRLAAEIACGCTMPSPNKAIVPAMLGKDRSPQPYLKG